MQTAIFIALTITIGCASSAGVSQCGGIGDRCFGSATCCGNNTTCQWFGAFSSGVSKCETALEPSCGGFGDPCMYDAGCCGNTSCQWANGSLACVFNNPAPASCQREEDGACMYDGDCCGSMTCQWIGQSSTKRLACEAAPPTPPTPPTPPPTFPPTPPTPAPAPPRPGTSTYQTQWWINHKCSGATSAASTLAPCTTGACCLGPSIADSIMVSGNCDHLITTMFLGSTNCTGQNVTLPAANMTAAAAQGCVDVRGGGSSKKTTCTDN